MFRVKCTRAFTLTCGGAALALFVWTAHMSTLPPDAVNLNEHPHFYSGSRPQSSAPSPVLPIIHKTPLPESLPTAEDQSTAGTTPVELSPAVVSATMPTPTTEDVPYHSPIPASDLDLDLPSDMPPSSTPTPRMTLIVLWSPQDRDASYLPNFFASAGANPSIDVLLIKFDKYGLGAEYCEAPQAAGVLNVREVCVDMEEYWDLHIDWLCAEWGCDARMREMAREVMVRRLPADRVNSFYRPFRAEVFNKYMLPGVDMWAWADLDVVLGNMDRAFPWDLASSFDVVLAGWPTNWSTLLLYMPGHFTAFRRSPDVARAFQRAVPALVTYNAFVGEEFEEFGDACEEGEYSHALFMRTGLRFLRFDAMVDAGHHINTLDGVFAVEDDHALPTAPTSTDLAPKEATLLSARPAINAALASHTSPDGPEDDEQQRTFTTEGLEAPVTLRQDASAAPFVWFAPQYAVAYDSPLAQEIPGNGRHGRRYVMRRDVDGPVTERFEPAQRIHFDIPGQEVGAGRERAWLREGLYTHLQAEKYASWWALPERALEPGEVLYVDKEHGAHVWDADANLVWQSPRVAAL
ncbi:hypothetical protein PENSPDRAFT_685664 [Peniophora sp. CONT]|nr:hypothetical protein PENSPDRAFT_685664 [Peniophora sp. CONT]